MRTLARSVALILLFAGLPAVAQDAAQPGISFSINGGQIGAPGLSTSIQLLLLFTILSVAPAILIMMTSFVRIVIVLGFLRSALTLQQPSNQIVIALSLFLTFFVMAPTIDALNERALAPLRAGEIQADAAISNAGDVMKEFMLRHAKETELRLFIQLARIEEDFQTPQDVPLRVVIPAFMLSELKTAFQMGLLVLLPFLVIDLVVASTLMSLGMMMLPPTVVTLPLKIMVFVLADGWALLVRSIVQSFA
jgi:flagellar biosynthetic protein FliP